MAKSERAFWSSLPGVLTGLAGILTASVALLGLALSQGWIGEDVRISVEPETLEFRRLSLPGEPKVVEVLNDGTAPIVLETRIEGDDASEFTGDGDDCTTSPLPPGRTCEVTVSFDGSGGSSASLVISANDGELSREVALEGKLL